MSNGIDIMNLQFIGVNIGTNAGESKSLAEFLQKLPKGGVLSGFVLKADKSKKTAIFHTPYGRFSAPNDLGLSKGDRFTIKLNNDGQKVDGNVVSVNDKEVDNRKVSFVFVDNNKARNMGLKTADTGAVAVSETLKALPRQGIINGSLQYLNLSRLVPSSLLHSQLASFGSIGANIAIKLMNKRELNHQLIVDGEVISDKKDGLLIKTIFGIIKPEEVSLPVGLKAKFGIKSLAGQDYDALMRRSLISLVTQAQAPPPRETKKVSEELSEAYKAIKSLLDYSSDEHIEPKDITTLFARNLPVDLEHDKANIIINKKQQERIFSLDFNNLALGKVNIVGTMSYTDKHMTNLKEFNLTVSAERESAEVTEMIVAGFYDSMEKRGLNGDIKIN